MDAASPADSRPYWLPGDLDIDALPEGLRLAISQILTPAYEELVLAAPNALERATAGRGECSNLGAATPDEGSVRTTALCTAIKASSNRFTWATARPSPARYARPWTAFKPRCIKSVRRRAGGQRRGPPCANASRNGTQNSRIKGFTSKAMKSAVTGGQVARRIDSPSHPRKGAGPNSVRHDCSSSRAGVKRAGGKR